MRKILVISTVSDNSVVLSGRTSALSTDTVVLEKAGAWYAIGGSRGLAEDSDKGVDPSGAVREHFFGRKRAGTPQYCLLGTKEWTFLQPDGSINSPKSPRSYDRWTETGHDKCELFMRQSFPVVNIQMRSINEENEMAKEPTDWLPAYISGEYSGEVVRTVLVGFISNVGDTMAFIPTPFAALYRYDGDSALEDNGDLSPFADTVKTGESPAAGVDYLYNSGAVKLDVCDYEGRFNRGTASANYLAALPTDMVKALGARNSSIPVYMDIDELSYDLSLDEGPFAVTSDEDGLRQLEYKRMSGTGKLTESGEITVTLTKSNGSTVSVNLANLDASKKIPSIRSDFKSTKLGGLGALALLLGGVALSGMQKRDDTRGGTSLGVTPDRSQGPDAPSQMQGTEKRKPSSYRDGLFN